MPDPEFPSRARLNLFGEAIFLAARSKLHAGMPLGGFREVFAPPIEQGQFRIFRFDDVPRGLFTWAWLTPEAERRYVDGKALSYTDWTAGDRLWIVDFLAPYRGLTAGMVRWIMTPGSLPARQFLYRRASPDGKTRRIVHIDLDRPDDKSRPMDARAFLSDLARA